MASKSQLAIKLSKIHVFGSGDIGLEQYPTDSEIAAESLWVAYMNGDIEGKVIADLGAGTGILGIAALELGAKLVFFVEKDQKAVEILKKNLSPYSPERYAIFASDIHDFNGSMISADEKIDTIVMNPPFGTKAEHADREFLIRAFSLCCRIYSFHKTSTARFVESVSSSSGFQVVFRKDFNFPLKQTYPFHRSRIKRIEVSLFYLVKG